MQNLTDKSLTFNTSSKSFSEMSGNSILWEGSMMACSLAIWLVMLWNGVFPYVMQYRIQPRDHTSPLGLIFKEDKTKCSPLYSIRKDCLESWIDLVVEPLIALFLAVTKCLWWLQGACSLRFQPVRQTNMDYNKVQPFPSGVYIWCNIIMFTVKSIMYN